MVRTLSTILEEAIVDAMTRGRGGKGTIVVFSSGNDGVMDYPANFDDRIIAVGAIGQDGYRWQNSGYGNALDIVAPGENVYSTTMLGFTDYMTGTSMAAPHVSATAALMLSVNPDLTRADVERILGFTAKRIRPETYSYYFNYGRFEGNWCQQMGYGLLDAGAAVNLTSLSMSSYLPSGGYSIGLFDMGSLVFSGSGTISYALGGHTFGIGIEQNANPNYTYFWQVYDAPSINYTPVFGFTSGSGGSLVMPSELPVGSTFKIRCYIFNGSTLVGAPMLTINVSMI